MAVLLSGSGTTLENFFVRMERNELPAEVVCVVSSLSKAFGLERARRRGVPTAVVARKKYKSAADYSRAVFAELEKHRPDLVCLAGFMVHIEIPRRWLGRVMNVHPALIPAFCGKGMYGHLVHEAVLASGVKVTGCTVHFVDNEYDHGPIILQKAVEVRPDDTAETLAERVQAAERECYPEAVRLFAEGRLAIDGSRVRIT
jgi:formyltetrahydrofolate-dependent phosphoribosylglycinamide formyltransferase